MYLRSIIIKLAYLYYAAYTRMTLNESSPPCEQRRFTFNDDGQRVQLALPELTAPHYICMYRLLPTTPPSPFRHYYPRLIAGTNLPSPKGWIAWLAKADCTHINFAQGYFTQLNPKAPEGNGPRLSGPRPTQYQWTNRAVHYRPRIKSQKTAQSAAGVEPTTFRTAATDDDKDQRLYRNGHNSLSVICYQRPAVADL